MADIIEPIPIEPVTTEPEPKPLFTDDELYNLRAIKLSNGNDILACIVFTDDKHMIVKRPCQILQMGNSNGTITMMLAKWQPFSDGELQVINVSTVVTHCRINKEMMMFYIKSVINQIQDENSTKESIKGKTWPNWMDQPLTKAQIN